ncbi:hypothetical protein ACHAPJ_009388 [Fusarium lateritium]
MSPKPNEFLEYLNISSDYVTPDAFAFYSESDQEPDKFNLDFLQDSDFLFDIDQGEGSNLPSQPAPDEITDQSPFGNHLSSTTVTLSPYQHVGSLPVTQKPSPTPAASRVTPPKIGSRFSREAVHVLRDWLAANIENPFPNDEEKEILGFRTGLTRTQILNWLANARRRSKLFTRPLDLPQPSQSTKAINVPERRDTPAPTEGLSLMTPLERWVDSPPEHEPAAPTAISACDR